MKHDTLDSVTGLPEVAPSAIKAYRKTSRHFEDDFATLKTTHPHVAHELMIRAEVHSRDVTTKHAFAKGALFMYTLLLHSLQSNAIQALLQRSAFNDDADDANRPPSI